MNWMVALVKGRFSDFSPSPLLSARRPLGPWGVVGSRRRYFCVLKTIRSEGTSESEEVTVLSGYLAKSREHVRDENA